MDDKSALLGQLRIDRKAPPAGAGHGLLWLAVVALVFSPFEWANDRLTYGVPMWVWQLVLVPPAVVLAISPVIGHFKSQRSSEPGVARASS